ncbi:MAG: hypothetical protein M3P29_11195, partial [Acidobacteriota bacterium]|nr:hypothetical protein [Acidobacteriota bacterium]
IRAHGVAAALGELEGTAHEVFHGGDCPSKKPAIARRLRVGLKSDLRRSGFSPTNRDRFMARG